MFSKMQGFVIYNKSCMTIQWWMMSVRNGSR